MEWTVLIGETPSQLVEKLNKFMKGRSYVKIQYGLESQSRQPMVYIGYNVVSQVSMQDPIQEKETRLGEVGNPKRSRGFTLLSADSPEELVVVLRNFQKGRKFIETQFSYDREEKNSIVYVFYEIVNLNNIVMIESETGGSGK